MFVFLLTGTLKTIVLVRIAYRIPGCATYTYFTWFGKLNRISTEAY